MLDALKLNEAWKTFEKCLNYERRIQSGEDTIILRKGLELMLTKACKLELEALGYAGS